MSSAPAPGHGRSYAKCLVWDLDGTLWSGVLAEDDSVALRPGAAAVVQALDQRGILQSVASRNDHDAAIARLRYLGLDSFFLCPQIGWGAKADSVRHIAETLGIDLECVAFLDDEAFERDEVSFYLPSVRCLDARDLDSLLDLPEMNPPAVSEDTRARRASYLRDGQRLMDEEAYNGPKEAFLASLGMKLSVFPAEKGDLARAVELTVRTNQLNSTGYTYTLEELDRFRRSEHHLLLMARLEDRYGDYGRIGLALVACAKRAWTLKLLLTSCRVISRGVGTVLLHHVMRCARDAGAPLCADLRRTGRNRMVEISFRLAGFHEVKSSDDGVLLKQGPEAVPPPPTTCESRSADRDPQLRAAAE